VARLGGCQKSPQLFSLFLDMNLNTGILLGLDDIAHNRLFELVKGKYVKVANYGKRDSTERCYCLNLNVLIYRARRMLFMLIKKRSLIYDR